MDPMALLVAVGAMAVLGVTLSSVLAVANRQFYVYEDPLIGQVETLLPGTNCGACGQPGCRMFAEQAVTGAVEPGKCTVSTEEGRESIATLLGVDVGGGEKVVARLACAGGTHVARQRAHYVGEPTCRAATLVAGGGKGCVWGCLGFGDCDVVCDFDAIVMNSFGLPIVDEDLCTACGDCVDVCPKNLFSLHPLSHKLWVACANEAFGDEAENECEVACNACARCVADAPEGVARMESNLPVIDYTLNQLTNPEAIQRCPTGAIVWWGMDGSIAKGSRAKPVIRRHALPVG